LQAWQQLQKLLQQWRASAGEIAARQALLHCECSTVSSSSGRKVMRSSVNRTAEAIVNIDLAGG
jgi:hypothetical protein